MEKALGQIDDALNGVDADKKIAATKDGEMQSYTRAKLTKGTYYYKIRSYVTVDGTKYYSPYSSVKSVKIRR